jgi:hypothetical protein
MFKSQTVFLAYVALVVIDVSAEPLGLIFKGQAVQEDCLTLEDETDKLTRNVGN